MSEKKAPNPYGKKGSIPHQEKVEEVAKEIEKKGLFVIIEYFLRMFTGN